jgi:hypothetical protein
MVDKNIIGQYLAIIFRSQLTFEIVNCLQSRNWRKRRRVKSESRVQGVDKKWLS